MMRRIAHFRISPDLYEEAQQAAEAERRTFSNWVATLVERALDEARRGADASPAGTSGAMSP